MVWECCSITFCRDVGTYGDVGTGPHHFFERPINPITMDNVHLMRSFWKISQIIGQFGFVSQVNCGVFGVFPCEVSRHILSLCAPKGQTISKWFFKPTFLPKNEQTNSTLLLVDLFSFVFWKKVKTPKRHFEINWPLVHDFSSINHYFYKVENVDCAHSITLSPPKFSVLRWHCFGSGNQLIHFEFTLV